MSEGCCWLLTFNTSLSAPGTLAHRLQNPKRPLGAPKMVDNIQILTSTIRFLLLLGGMTCHP